VLTAFQIRDPLEGLEAVACFKIKRSCFKIRLWLSQSFTAEDVNDV
jgi:hypothetical protein